MTARVIRLPVQRSPRLAAVPAPAPEPTAPALTEVRLAPEQLQLLLDAVRRPAAAEGKVFEVLAKEWLQRVAPTLVCPANERRHIEHLRALWSLREGTLTPNAVKECLGQLAAPPAPARPLCAATLNKVRSTGKRIVRDAQENGEWGAVNPFEVVRRRKESKRKYETLALEEIERVLPHLRPDRRQLARVALLLGARPGELLGAKKTQVRVAQRALVISRSHGRDQTKTGRSREVPIPQDAWPDIEAALKTPGEWLFPRPDGTRQRQDTKLSRILRTAMVKAGLVVGYRYTCRRKGCGHQEQRAELLELNCPSCAFRLWPVGLPRPVRFYDLRHAAATLHRKAGADPLAVKLALGHAVQDVTDDVYTHLDEAFMRAELGKLRLEAGEASPENPGDASPERRKGFEPSTPSLGSLGPSDGPQAAIGSGPPVGGPPAPRPEADGDLLNVGEVATALRCSTKTVYRLVELKQLAAIRVGSALRIERRTLRAFVAAGGAR